MNFIGPSPPISQNQLSNSTFSEPPVTEGYFTSVPGIIDVIPWWCSGYLCNNFSGGLGIPLPYASGNQCIVLSIYQGLGQLTDCPEWNYTISFYACGNTTLNVLFYETSNMVPDNNPYTTVTLTNEWQLYTFNVYAPAVSYLVGICGQSYSMGTLGAASEPEYIGIQNFTFGLTEGNGTGGPPIYTFETCQEQAVLGGNQYFSLQNANNNNNLGYCAVSKYIMEATQLGSSDNCSILSNGYYGGGPSTNAIYNTQEAGDYSLINNVYYVDPNANVTQYSSENLSPSTNYSMFPNIDTPGNDLGPSNTTLDQCEQICNGNNSCSGFVFDNINNICWPKNSNMWPYSNDVVNYSEAGSTRNIYVKMNKLNNGSINNSNNTKLSRKSLTILTGVQDLRLTNMRFFALALSCIVILAK
jgi:hypothetical protein